MAILFSYGSRVAYRTQEETDQLRAETAARGVTPQVLPREGFVHRKHDEFEELRGAFIEIKQDAITEIDRHILNEAGELDREKYGTTWRIWTGGIPTQEQMDTTPWET